MPILALPRFLFWLLGLAILIGAVWLLRDWWVGDYIRDQLGRVHHLRGPTWELVAGLALLSWSALGRPIVLMLMPGGPDRPHKLAGTASQVAAPDGSLLHVEAFGPEGAPVLVMTHGWGLTSDAWFHAKQELAGRFRLVVWDLPGLGRSKGPTDGRYTMDRFAQALGAVVEASGAPRVVLVGHSIGGMMSQTFWRACPEALRGRVAGMVLVDTTYQNPLHTMIFARLWTALQKPLIEPLNHLTVWVAPLAWLANWQGYLNGSAQLAMRVVGFGSHATRGQVDYTAYLPCLSSPAVQAKGNLAMIRWSAADVTPRIDVPLLVLAGQRDIVTLPSASERIAETAPRAELLGLEGAGHMGFMEQSQACNTAIASFAGRVLAQAAPEAPRRPRPSKPAAAAPAVPMNGADGLGVWS